MALYARFLDEILLRRCGGGDFIGNRQTVTLAYKNDMTSTFATQLISQAGK